MPALWSGAVIAHGEGQEMEHQVWIQDVIVAPDETAALEMVRGTRPAPQEEPFRADERPSP